MILRCNCHHTVQDKLYGPKLRVHNPAKPGESEQKYRCTVCHNLRGA